MKTAVRYYSRTGNTKVIAEAIAPVAGCQAESIEVPLEGVRCGLLGKDSRDTERVYKEPVPTAGKVCSRLYHSRNSGRCIRNL